MGHTQKITDGRFSEAVDPTGRRPPKLVKSGRKKRGADGYLPQDAEGVRIAEEYGTAESL
jgi:hypothetical protein